MTSTQQTTAEGQKYKSTLDCIAAKDTQKRRDRWGGGHHKAPTLPQPKQTSPPRTQGGTTRDKCDVVWFQRCDVI